jgi:glycerol kinase
MMKILAIDQGTTLTKALILTDEGEFQEVGRSAHQQFHPASGHAEHDAEELASNIEALIDHALAKEPDIAGIALANQGETVVAWDRRTKKPLYRAIVWQDQRTQPVLDALPLDARAYIKTHTGLPIDAYFSAAKLAWLLENIAGVADAAQAGYLGLATSDAFFIDRLTNVYASDVTTASRTSLMDLRACKWDVELCRIFDIPPELLPAIQPSTGRFGLIQRSGHNIPLVASIVDQQAALFGHGCHSLGDAKITFGTGSFALVNTGYDPVLHQDRTCPTVAWMHSGKRPVYALDSGDYTASAAVNWAIGLGIAKNLADFHLPEGSSALERGLVFVPALAGLAAPHWDRAATGLWIGLRQNTTAADMRCAILEGIALRAVELIESLPTLNDKPVAADGGLTAITGFVGFLADVLGRPVRLSLNTDVTAIGAAELGFMGLGLKPPQRARGNDRLILPTAASPKIRALRSIFSQAITASCAFGRIANMMTDGARRSP